MSPIPIVDLLSYVTRFQWDRARYPPGLPLSSLTELIDKVQSDCQQACFSTWGAMFCKVAQNIFIAAKSLHCDVQAYVFYRKFLRWPWNSNPERLPTTA